MKNHAYFVIFYEFNLKVEQELPSSQQRAKEPEELSFVLCTFKI